MAYFTIDSGFVIAFTMVFVGLYVLTRPRAPEFAAFALAAGIWTGVADAVENGLYWVYAMRAQAGVALTEFDTPLLPLLSNLKMVGFRHVSQLCADLPAPGLAGTRDGDAPAANPGPGQYGHRQPR